MGLPVVIENPRRIRDFAKAVGQLAKTDRLDARIIARYAATIKPEAKTATDAISVEIKELNTRRRQLVAIRTAEKYPTEHAAIDRISENIRTVITTVEAEIEAIGKQIDTLIDQNEMFKRKAEILASTPGIGTKTVGMLSAPCPNPAQSQPP